jgi:two-component system OmpR family response regulator
MRNDVLDKAAPLILLVEDDRKIAQVVEVYLAQAGFRVVSFDKGKGAIEAASIELPVLAILDLKLPDITGEEVCQEFRQIGDFPVIMLTSKSSEDERLAGFALGADDYVVKPFSPRELVYRVKAVLKRMQKGDLSGAKPMSFEGGELVVDGRSYQLRSSGSSVNLTPTEFKVLFTIASSPDKVFTREELVEKAMGYQFEGYERSVDAHIKHIRQKLHDDPRNPRWILTVYGVGYKFIGRPDA